MARGLVAGSDDYNRGFRRIVIALIWLIIVPTALLLAVGTVMLVFYHLQANVMFGLLVVALAACLVTGVVLALVFLRREADLSRLQLDFVSKVSHELRTPLTSIRMFVETLRFEHEQRKVETCLDVLQAETERLSARIERLLDWGRMEAGRRVYHLESDQAEVVIAEAVAQFEASSVSRGRQLGVEIEPNLPQIRADREALVDALLNLLHNARKYSEEDAPIVVRAYRERDRVLIAIKDRGIGIARQEHRRVFEKFYRSDDRLSRSVEGSGLGLSIVKHVMQAHGGKVTLESAVGEGSVFTLSLPIERRAAEAAAPAAATPAAPARGGEPQ